MQEPDFGRIVGELLETMSQDELAERVRASQSMISRLKRRVASPDYTLGQKLLELHALLQES